MKSKKADDIQQIFCRTKKFFKMTDPIAKTITQIEGYIIFGHLLAKMSFMLIMDDDFEA